MPLVYIRLSWLETQFAVNSVCKWQSWSPWGVKFLCLWVHETARSPECCRVDVISEMCRAQSLAICNNRTNPVGWLLLTADFNALWRRGWSKGSSDLPFLFLECCIVLNCQQNNSVYFQMRHVAAWFAEMYKILLHYWNKYVICGTAWLSIGSYVSKVLSAISAQVLTAGALCEILGFHLAIDENCDLLSYYAACTGS